jgi:nicotinate phosphoribosyltransferase
VLSNNLDEMVIWQIITQIIEESPRYGVDPDALISRLAYGVGTRLIVSWGEPALGGVYKLVAVCDKNKWLPAIKISESPEKTPNPGHKKAWRIYDQRGRATADLLGLEEEDPVGMERILLRHPSDQTKLRVLEHQKISSMEPLLVDILIDGKRVGPKPTLEEIRTQRQADMDRLDPGVRRIINPHIYHVSLTQRLYDLKQSLIRSTLDSAIVDG